MLLKKFKLDTMLNYFIKVLFVFFIGIAVFNIFIFRDNLPQVFNYKLIITFDIIYILVMFGIMFLKNKIRINKIISNIIKIILLIILLSVQVFYAYSISRDIGFDYAVVFNSAIDLMNGKPPSLEYFAMYENNIFLLLLKEIIFKVASVVNIDAYLMVDILFNIFIIDLAILFSYKICKKVFGGKYSFVSLFLLIPILGFTPYIAVAYTDTLSLIFPVLILYFYLLYKERKNVIYIALIAAFSVLGVLLKPTNIIILIAIIIIEFIKNLNKEKIKNILNDNFKNKIINFSKALLIVIVVSSIIYTGFSKYKDIKIGMYISDESFEKHSFPMTHFMMMGLKPTDVEGKYYGYYLFEDVEATQAQIGKKAKTEYHISEIKKRLNKMGFSGYLEYLYDKYTVIISDGGFFYGNEGHFFVSEPYAKFEISKKIQEYTCLKTEKFNKYTLQFMQAYWSLILMLIFINTLKQFNRKEHFSINLMRLTIIGIILFNLLFEARSRYFINHLPIFIMLASYSLILLYKKISHEKIELIEKKAEQKKERRECKSLYKIKEYYYKYKEMVNYIIFGVLTTLINYISYVLCTRVFDIDILISNLIAWIISVLFAFVTNKLIVFESKNISIKVIAKEFFAFMVARIFSLALDMGILYVMSDILKINDLIVKIISNVIVIIVNYIISKFIIFKNNKNDK